MRTRKPMARQAVTDSAERDRRVTMVAVTALRPHPGNARTHSRPQIRAIARSIEQFGFVSPVLIDEAGLVLAGHGRVEAAKLLRLAEVPTLCIAHLSAAEKRAYLIADNKLAERAGWDREILAIELQALLDLDFDVELTGFETAEIDLLISDAAADPAADAVPAVDPETPPVSRPGDLWLLGDTGDAAVHADSGESFAALAQAREPGSADLPARPAKRRGTRR